MKNKIGQRWVVVVAALLIGCSGSQRDADEPARPSTTGPVEPVEAAPESLEGEITTAQLQRVLGRSAGEFLGLVELEAQVDDGSFGGWRIVRLPPSTPGWLDVRTGDVVTAINGLPVERPEDAQQIWELLRVASEVRIDLLRRGEARSVRIPVVDGPGEAPAPDERRGPDE